MIVVDIDPGRPTEFMDFIDPLAAEKLRDGELRAPRLDEAAVFRKYGKRG